MVDKLGLQLLDRMFLILIVFLVAVAFTYQFLLSSVPQYQCVTKPETPQTLTLTPIGK